MNINAFRKKYPSKVMRLQQGVDVTYRYYNNPQSEATVVLLIGCPGFSDLLYLHFERFAKDFSVLTLDCEKGFLNNDEMADVLAELLRDLDEKAWIVGLYLGGVVAQIVASRHPDVVTGLVLVNTCLLSKEMSSAAYGHVMNLLDGQEKLKNKLSVLPFSLVKRSIKRTLINKGEIYTRSEKKTLETLCDTLMMLMTKQKLLFLLDALVDAKKYCGVIKSDFENWKRRVLLVLSDDDTMFFQSCNQTLVAQMTQPVVYTELPGGLLAPLVHMNQLTEVVTGFILDRRQ